MKGRGALAALALLAAGCGDPLTPGGTFESPLLSFAPFFPDPVADLEGKNIGIVWVDPLGQRDDLPQPPTGIAVRRSSALEFTVGLFGPPPEEAIRRLPDPAGGVAVSFAFGEIVLYEDGGEPGFAISPRKTGSLMFPPDAYRGATDRRAIVYIETPARPAALDPAVWKTLLEPPGYRLVEINCDYSPATVETAKDNQKVSMLFFREPSAELVVTRTCLSPTRPAVGPQP